MEKISIKSNFSILDLVKKYNLDNKKIAVEYNGDSPKIRYKKILKDNDKLEIVHFIGGG